MVIELQGVATLLGGGALTFFGPIIHEEIKARRARNLAKLDKGETIAAKEQQREDDRLDKAIAMERESHGRIEAALQARIDAYDEEMERARAFYHEQLIAKDREIEDLRVRLTVTAPQRIRLNGEM